MSRINNMPFQNGQRVNRERNAIVIKTAGKTVYSSNGKDYISDSGHITILSKASSYSWTCFEKGECLMIEFESDPDCAFPDLQSFKVPGQPEFISIFNELELLWTFKSPAYYLKCIAGIYNILAKLEESKLVDYRFTEKYNIIKPSLQYLEEHYSDPALCNDKLAQISGISTVYFRKIFSGLYHASPMRYIQNIRIEKAKDLLLCEYCSITETAEVVGFSNIYHFSKTFKKATGYTPSEFSRKYSANVIT